MKGICVGLIGWIYKHAPKGYERRIYSFLYDQAVIRDERGYSFTAKIPDKKNLQIYIKLCRKMI